MQECFEYLDDLRVSGTNMFAAGPYLEEAFGLQPAGAHRVLGLWMTTFSQDKSAAERAAASHELTTRGDL
jgi:hypothetical protein